MLKTGRSIIVNLFTLLLFTLLLTVNIYAGEGLVYYNGEATEYKTYTDENGVLYIPFYMLADFYNGEVTWNEANQEAVLKLPVMGERRNAARKLERAVLYLAEYKVKAQSDFLETVLIYDDTEPRPNVLRTYKYESGQTFIKDNRLMVPAFIEEKSNSYLPAHSRSHHLELWGWAVNGSDMNYINSSEPAPEDISQSYKKYMIDRDKWILTSDSEYIIDFEMYGAAKNKAMLLLLKGKDGLPIRLELPWPLNPNTEEAKALYNEGVVLNGILVTFGHPSGRTLFGKESVLNAISSKE